MLSCQDNWGRPEEAQGSATKSQETQQTTQEPQETYWEEAQGGARETQEIANNHTLNNLIWQYWTVSLYNVQFYRAIPDHTLRP
jgi:hypothetical protein